MSATFDAEDLERLVRRCQEGDERAWGALIDRFQNLVYSIPRRMGVSAEDSDDVFQATFFALYRSLDKLDEPSALGKWLSVTASREAIRVRRLSGATVTLGDEEKGLEELLADEEADAERAAVAAFEAEEVRTALLAMPHKCRDLLAMLYLSDDPSYQEISGRLGIAVGSIGPTRARCLDKLRMSLAKSGFFSLEAYQGGAAAAPTRVRR